MNFDVTYECIDNAILLVFRPSEQLTDYEYDKLKPYMESMGGHWRERLKGFVFSLNSLERNEYSRWKEDIQYFPTPKSVAKRVIELAELDNCKYKPYILEPSAGTGNLLDAIPNNIEYDLHAIEPECINANTLKEKGYKVELCSFEEFYNKYKGTERAITHVIMNPPFSLGRDIHHTRLAYELLKEGGTLVSIVSENSLYYDNEDSMKFNKWLKQCNAHIEPIPNGAFKESGTTVDTVIIKIIK